MSVLYFLSILIYQMVCPLMYDRAETTDALAFVSTTSPDLALAAMHKPPSIAREPVPIVPVSDKGNISPKEKNLF